jgi:transaldolase/glucose-6-phosphate isomerase
MNDGSRSVAERRGRFAFHAGSVSARVAELARRAAHAIEGLFRHDPAAWSAETAVQQKISERLGWLDVPRAMVGVIPRLTRFADEVSRDGFTHVVLLGMGGSSLAPEVLRTIVGIAPGRPAFTMLDSTDPAAIAAVECPLDRTLFVLASKSGTTIEPNSLAAYFHEQLSRAGVPSPASRFIAITDPGTELATRASAERFREAFLNPADIGGRYSALSLFGLVPAALMGQPIDALLDSAIAMADACRASGDVTTNPGAVLGLAMAAAAQEGRDKLTLLLPPALAPFGLWVEQLVAESTGKQGVGIVPIAGEAPARSAASFGGDRLFVHMRDAEHADTHDAVVNELIAANVPVMSIDLADRPALGGEFMRWEIATAVAGALLGINPFDEPNVQQAKDATRELLAAHQKTGRFPQRPAGGTLAGNVSLTLSTAAAQRVATGDPADFLKTLGAGDYLAVLGYLGADSALLESIATFRSAVRDRTRNASMFGYGPRYLHSTGQLHKGGPNSGVFVLITAAPVRDLDIPGQPFSFGTLELAQALGDFASLDRSGRRALHVHLPTPTAATLEAALNALLSRI